jgi:hypothetical protein
VKPADQRKRNLTVEIIGVALLGVMVYWLLLPPSTEPTSPEWEENQIPEAPPPANLLFTEEGIRALSPSIRDARLLPRDGDTPRTYDVDIAIDKTPLGSGASDWNAVAHDIRSLSELLLRRPEPAHISFTFISPEQGNLKWARANVDRDQLPEDWQEQSYLKFFSAIQAEAATSSSREWLCDFYRQYANARPDGAMPAQCSSR